MALDTLPVLSDAQIDDLLSDAQIDDLKNSRGMVPVAERAEITFDGVPVLLIYVAGKGMSNREEHLFYAREADLVDGRLHIGSQPNRERSTLRMPTRLIKSYVEMGAKHPADASYDAIIGDH